MFKFNLSKLSSFFTKHSAKDAYRARFDEIYADYMTNLTGLFSAIDNQNYDGAMTILNDAYDKVCRQVNVFDAKNIIIEALFKAIHDTHLSYILLKTEDYRNALFYSENALLLFERDKLEDHFVYTKALVCAIESATAYNAPNVAISHAHKLNAITAQQTAPDPLLVSLAEDAIAKNTRVLNGGSRNDLTP